MNGRGFRDWYRVRPGYWFAPKMFGFGATPVTWQGWLATLAFVALAFPIALLAKQRGPIFLVLLVPLLGGFLWLCHAKTDGGMRWRWGRDGD